MKIRDKLLGLSAVFIVGFGSFWYVSQRTQAYTSVGGPEYAQVALGKDLVADVLPPPAYILEAQLNVIETQDEDHPDVLAQLMSKGTKLREEFEARGFVEVGSLRDRKAGRQPPRDVLEPPVDDEPQRDGGERSGDPRGGGRRAFRMG